MDRSTITTQLNWLFRKLSLLKYNVLVLLQIIVGLLNTIIIMSSFGVSQESDTYFMAFGIISTIQLLLFMFVEQFLVFYGDIKATDEKEANLFFNVVFLYSIVTGVISFLLLYLFSDSIIDIFSSGLKESAEFQELTMLNVILLSLSVFPASFILASFLNSNSYYSIPYITTILPNVFILIYFLCCLYFRENISLITSAWFYVGGNILGFFLLFYYSNRLSKINFITKHERLKSFIKHSVSMRFAHNIHNFIFLFFTNNFLSYFHNGEITQFYYAKKVTDILNSIVNGPAQKILSVEISHLIPNKNYIVVKKITKIFLLRNIPIFIILSIMAYFAISLVLPLITNKISFEATQSLMNMFVLLSIMNILIMLEMPSTIVNITLKDLKVFYIANSIFAVIFISFSLALMHFYDVYSLFIGLICGQVSNLFFQVKRAKNKMRGLTQ